MGKKRQKKGEQQCPNVAEATTIWISQILEQFRESKADVYTFGANLTNCERASVHEIVRKMGMKSKSSGKGAHRCVSVYKVKGRLDDAKKKGNTENVIFSEETRMVLQDLFVHYPPLDGESEEKLLDKHTGRKGKKKKNKDDIFCKPLLKKEDIAKKMELLASRVEKTANLQQIAEQRSKLPIAPFKDAIVSAVEANQVVLISGETGCGKTTQVPQFLLDSLWSKGEACKIICTQPRRISATSVSERIAYERGEVIGNDIGYKIRLESKGGRNTSVVFCTNGILVRVLVSKGTGSYVSDATHIIVDEIHERDCYCDFMLAIIRDLLPSNPHLRLILMSATFDAERFSLYFGGCPIIRVPGSTHPVRTYYLEDVLSILNSADSNHLNPAHLTAVKETGLTEEDKIALDEAIILAWIDDEFDALLDFISMDGNTNACNYQHSTTGITPLMVFAGKGRVSDVCMLLSVGVDCRLRSKDGFTALELAEQENHLEIVQIIKEHSESVISDLMERQQLLDRYLATINPDHVDVALIENLLTKICTGSDDGAILVFLPGWEDINRTREKLLARPFFRDNSKFVIISLHSMAPAAEQRKVFRRLPPGCRKIVLATNIAESAITIDDVVFVVDSGRMKEKSYDPYSNVSTLQSSWVSKANARQREGRAGRCQPGICYHLYSKLRASNLLDFQVPEIKRMPIEELCLQVKMLDPSCKIANFLQMTLDPPVEKSIHNAILILQEIGALSYGEELTELGERLGQLPVHPSTSKMLFVAVLMNCLEPALTMACAADYREPFTLPMLPNEKRKAAAAKAELASLYGGQSDHLAIIAAFECWKTARHRGQEAKFCNQYFVSSRTMCMLDGMRKQLQSELIRNGFISDDVSSCSLNARDTGILQAVLVAGLYPMVGRLCSVNNGRRSVLEVASGAKVRLHSYSINFGLSYKNKYDSPLLMYDEVTRGDGGMSVRNCSVVAPLPLLLLANEIAVAPAKYGESDDDDDDNDDEDESDDGSDEDAMEIEKTESQQRRIMSSPDKMVMVVIDRWLSYMLKALDIAQIYCLRERLSAAILFKVKNPREVLPPVLGASMYAIACVLSYDGLSGLSMLPESVESITSMVNSTGIEESRNGKKGPGKSPNNFLMSLFMDRRSGHSSFHGSHHVHSLSYAPSTAAGTRFQWQTTLHRNSAHAADLGGSRKVGPKVDSFKRSRGDRH